MIVSGSHEPNFVQIWFAFRALFVRFRSFRALFVRFVRFRSISCVLVFDLSITLNPSFFCFLSPCCALEVAFARGMLKMYEISAAGSVLAGKDLSEALVMVRLIFPALNFLKIFRLWQQYPCGCLVLICALL